MKLPLSKMLLLAVAFLLTASYFVDAEPQRDVVGFWTLELNPGFNLVAFPVLPDLPTPRDVIGSRLGSVEITTWDRGYGSYRWARYNPETGTWLGNLYLLDRGVAYWINLTDTDESQQLVITGRPERYRKFRWSQLKTGWDFYSPTYGKVQNLHDLPPDKHDDLLISWNRQSAQFELAHASAEGEWLAGEFDSIYPDQAYISYLNREDQHGDDTPTSASLPYMEKTAKGSNPGLDIEGNRATAYENPPHPLVVSNINGLPVCQTDGEICNGGFTIDVIREEQRPDDDGRMQPDPQIVVQHFIADDESVGGLFYLPLTVGRGEGHVRPGDRIYLIARRNEAETRSTSFEVTEEYWIIRDISFPEPMSIPGETAATPESFALGNPYPNPFNDRFQVDVNVPETSVLRYTLYDITGRVVQTVSSPFSAGTHRLSLSGRDLSNGIYLLEVVYGAQRGLAKVAFVK